MVCDRVDADHIALEKPVAKTRPRQKPTVTLTSFSILILERERIDVETQRSQDHKCYEVSKAIIWLLRHDQSVPRESDGAIHYSDTIDECRKKKFDDASQWLFEDWISTLAKGVRSEEKISMLCDSKLFQSALRAIQGHSGKSAMDPALQDIVLLPKGFTEYICHVRNAKELNSGIRNGFKRGRQAVFFSTANPMEDMCGMGETPCDLTKPRIAPCKNTWKRLQNTLFIEYTCHVGNANDWIPQSEMDWFQQEKASKEEDKRYFFTTVNPMEDVFGMGVTPCDLTKPRIAPYKNTWKRFQNTVLWCNLKLAQEKGLQFLPDTVTCSRSLQHTSCSLHWEGGMNENSGWALPKGSVGSKSATGCAKIELAIWSTRSTKPTSKITLGPIKRFEELRRNLEQRENKVKRLIENLRITSTRNPSFRTWARRRRSTSSAKNRRTWSPTWTTPRSSNFAKILPSSNVLTAMPAGKSVISIDAVEEIWSLRGVQQSSTRTTVTSSHLNPWICDQEKQQSWSEAQTFWKTTGVLPGETDAQKKRQTGKARTPSNDTFTMVRRRRIQKVIISHRVETTPHNVARQNRRGEAHLPRYKSWENSKFEAFDSHAKYRRRTAATTQSTTRLCSSERECKRLHDEHLARTQEEYRTIPRSQQIGQR